MSSAEHPAAPLRVAIIAGSTRPGRKAGTVARWVHGIAARRDDAAYEVVDLADYGLPLLDEPVPPMAGRYQHPHTLKWAATVASFDAYVFVTPEYNRSVPGALKNALDYLFAEWNDKAAGFVGYGFHGGVHAIEHLRLILGELKIAGAYEAPSPSSSARTSRAMPSSRRAPSRNSASPRCSTNSRPGRRHSGRSAIPRRPRPPCPR